MSKHLSEFECHWHHPDTNSKNSWLYCPFLAQEQSGWKTSPLPYLIIGSKLQNVGHYLTHWLETKWEQIKVDAKVKMHQNHQKCFFQKVCLKTFTSILKNSLFKDNYLFYGWLNWLFFVKSNIVSKPSSE